MASAGVCCANLEEPKALMKMGLSVILVGHVNFLLGALVHGVVLRHINLHKQARAMEYAISNVVALTAGLVGAVVGILAIILSKNKRSKGLMWSLFIISLASAFMAAASSIGLIVSIVRAIIHGGRSLLTHCRFPDAVGYSSVTNECPFDPTRIYSTTLVLWVPLIVTCLIQLVFSARCAAVCASLLGLPCCPTRKRPAHYTRAINVVKPVQATSLSDLAEPAQIYTEPPRTLNILPKRATAPPREYHPPPPPQPPPRQHRSLPPSERQPLRQHRSLPPSERQPLRQHRSLPPSERQPLRQHRSLPPSERQPLRQPYRERSARERSEVRAGSEQRKREQNQLLQRETHERSSFWI